MTDKEFLNKMSQTSYLVEATHTEQFFLWREFYTSVLWQSEQEGRLIPLQNAFAGSSSPMNMCVTWAKINHKRVMFWELTSRQCDYELAENWLRENVGHIWANGRAKTCDAMNFSHCIRECYEGEWPQNGLCVEDFWLLIDRAKKANENGPQQFAYITLTDLCRYLPNSLSR